MPHPCAAKGSAHNINRPINGVRRTGVVVPVERCRTRVNDRSPIFRCFLSAPTARWVIPAEDEPGQPVLIALPWMSRVPSAPRCLTGSCYLSIQLIFLPLAIWLSNGWVGTAVYSQALTGLIFLVKGARRRLQEPLGESIACGEKFEGDVSCAGSNSEVY